MANSEADSNIELPLEIMPSTLSNWLVEGKDIKILDIRPEHEYQYWHIAESENVVAYDELHRGQPGELANYQSDVPVVAVCFAGITSKAAVQYMRSKGIMATSLIGGMNLWNSAWNIAAVPTTRPSTEIIQLRRTGKGCLSYIIESDKKAVVIDPSIDPQIYIELADKNGWTIETVIDTHVHSDHVSRGKILAQATGGTYMLPANSNVSFSFESINNSHPIPIGDSLLSPSFSPGHTAQSMTFQLDGEFLFTGDTLFTSGISRPASTEDYTNQDKVKELATFLYETISSFTDLPQNLTILPGHTNKSVPFNGIPISISLEDALRPILNKAHKIDGFVDLLLTKIPPVPGTHAQIIRLNASGGFSGGNIHMLEGGENHAIIKF